MRRIDDLGRVVIPKEIRRTMRIREGEPLEIFVDREGEVILKKYSPIGELSDFAQKYADALAGEIDRAVFIMDRDVIIAVSGISRKVFMEKEISTDAEQVMESRRTDLIKGKGPKSFCKNCTEDFGEYDLSDAVLSPIIVEGDPIGVVVISNKTKDQKLGDLELKLANTASSFLGRHMEQ